MLKSENQIKISRRRALALGCTAALSYSLASALGSGAAFAMQPASAGPPSEDGYRVWLRYNKLQDTGLLSQYERTIKALCVPGQSPTAQIVRDELERGLTGLLGIRIINQPELAQTRTNNILMVLAGHSPLLHEMVDAKQVEELGAEGFLIRSFKHNGDNVTLIAANTDTGTLYGAFAFLRLLQTAESTAALDIVDRPGNALRILAHSDNVYPAVDRGYSGNSLWQWKGLPGNIEQIKPRLIDYARINASLGLNGTIINKVEADPAFIDSTNLAKVVALADVLRPYGIKVYVSANFASPMALGGLPTADPLDARVC